ncbi:hypothetical protein Bequi_13340 [Brachybacterium sp. JHP9]|uniref:Uncharacterized protein n=1 Tax=Brachybacterium equifaecis TaxID=2910770 RepID=A0ABT0R343_9MICO|nr:hypothetical protein [Brachybacterium equifaecis]MCL6424349.1 hypothetical protein [Brachybacterium equifaecis]
MRNRGRFTVIAVIAAAVIAAIVMLLLHGLRAGEDTVEPAPSGPAAQWTPSASPSAEPSPDAASSDPAAQPSHVSGFDASAPREVAQAFADTFGDLSVADLRAATADLATGEFAASLEGADRTPLTGATGFDLSFGETYDNALGQATRFTVRATGTSAFYELYVQCLPAEEGHTGGGCRVYALDWGPEMLGDVDAPGPLYGKVAPMSSTDVTAMVTTGDHVAHEVLRYVPGETPQARAARLALLMKDTGPAMQIQPPASRDGGYAMTVETTGMAFTGATAEGDPQAQFFGSWVDAYDPTYFGSFDVTVTWKRGDSGRYEVQSVQATPIAQNNGGDGD